MTDEAVEAAWLARDILTESCTPLELGAKTTTAKRNCLSKYAKHADLVWDSVFLTHKKSFSPTLIGRPQRPNRFDYFIWTDGEGISIKQVERTFQTSTAVGLLTEFRPKKRWKPPCKEVKVVRIKKGTEPYVTDPLFVAEMQKQAKIRIITVDPNARDLVHALEPNEQNPKKPTTFRYTSMQRRFETGEKAHRIEREALRNELGIPIAEVDLASCTHRTTDADQLRTWIRVSSKARSKTRSAYSKSRWRGMRFDKYRGVQCSEARFVNNFRAKFGPAHDAMVVAWGNWSKNPGLKCQGPVPGKRLRDALRDEGYKVPLLDEFGTSSTCYICQEPKSTVAPFKLCINPRPFRRESNPIVLRHGLVQCEHCSYMSFNRDVHACLNMQLIARAALSGQPRPPHLDRSRGVAVAVVVKPKTTRSKRPREKTS
jgi:hypothetical protein